MRAIMQPGQHASWALTMDSPTTDVCCISEIRIQDLSSVTQLALSSISAVCLLRAPRDEAVRAVGHCDIGLVLGDKAEASLLDWIPVSRRLCALRIYLPV